MPTNIPVIGRIYHVVQKETGRVIKVGSTIRPLHVRARQQDYRKKYPDCFLREAFTITSSDDDMNWYGFAGVTDPKKAFAPFLWNLIIAEHLEMLKMGTYQIPDETRSNQRFPIYQKLDGFDGSIAGSIGGRIGGCTTANRPEHKARLEKLHNDPAIRAKRSASLKASPKHKAHLDAMHSSLEWQTKTKARLEILHRSLEWQTKTKARLEILNSSPEQKVHLERLLSNPKRKAHLLTAVRSPEHKVHLERIRHIRWHVRRGIIKQGCKFCEVAAIAA